MNCLDSLLSSVGGRISSGGVRCVAVIGSGGKSTLLRALGEDAAARGGRVVLATTTHFLPFGGMPLVTSGDMRELTRALDGRGLACVGTPAADDLGRLAAPAMPLEELAGAADLLVVEADGSKRLPLKAHASHEPVVPACADLTACVVGASGFGGLVGERVHRAALLCERVGCGVYDTATPELVARGMADEMARGLIAPDVIVVNQAETPERAAAARRFAAALRGLGCETPVLLGSVRDERLVRA